MLGNGSLALARSRLLSPRVFVGLTEHSELSYCLLEHWLGVFDKSRCADTDMMEEMQLHAAALHRTYEDAGVFWMQRCIRCSPASEQMPPLVPT